MTAQTTEPFRLAAVGADEPAASQSDSGGCDLGDEVRATDKPPVDWIKHLTLRRPRCDEGRHRNAERNDSAHDCCYANSKSHGFGFLNT